MAEGFTRALKGNVIEPYSAGIEVRGIDPFAVAVMAEAEVDISRQRSKHVDDGSPDLLRQAVWSCYQETPAPFQGLNLYDPGAYPEPPLSGKITWRVTQPEREPKTGEERLQGEKLRGIMERIRKSVNEKRGKP